MSNLERTAQFICSLSGEEPTTDNVSRLVAGHRAGAYDLGDLAEKLVRATMSVERALRRDAS